MKLLIVFCALLASCASANMETTCKTMDWEKRGHDDAMVYATMPQIENYERQCRALGVEPDRAAYMDGWRDGYTEKDASM